MSRGKVTFHFLRTSSQDPSPRSERFSNSQTPSFFFFFPSVSSNARLQERGSEREGEAGCQLNPPSPTPPTPSRLTPLAGVLQRVGRKRGGLSGGGLEGNSLSSSGGTAGDKLPVGKPDRGSSFLFPFFTRACSNTERRASQNNLTAAVRIGVESHAASLALGRSLLILFLQVLFLFLPNSLSPRVFSSLTSCWTKDHHTTILWYRVCLSIP